MTETLKTEYDLREVAAHKFWQDARPGDQFRHMGGDFPDRIFTFVRAHDSGEYLGTLYLPVGATLDSDWDGRTYDYLLSIPMDDRVLWFKQIPWKGLDDEEGDES